MDHNLHVNTIYEQSEKKPILQTICVAYFTLNAHKRAHSLRNTLLLFCFKHVRSVRVRYTCDPYPTLIANSSHRKESPCQKI